MGVCVCVCVCVYVGLLRRFMVTFMDFTTSTLEYEIICNGVGGFVLLFEMAI